MTFRRAIGSVVIAGLAGGCQSLAASPIEGAGAVVQPRLVVLLVLDQWPEWAFEAKRPHLHAGGFDRLLAEGAWHVGRHPSAVTLTAPGHALLGTGQTTATSGIVGNEWWHRDAAKALKSVEAEDGAVTAKWLRVPGLGDALAAANTGAKAVSVSLKDRAAVLPLGHAGTAIWYSPRTVDWQSSGSPAWLADWNTTRPIAFHLHDIWVPLDPAQLAALSGRHDYQAGEVGEQGFGATFPHALDRTKNPAAAIFAAPVGNQIVLDTALAAVDGEGLGRGGTPDLLVVSLSAHDYIAHGWGHESWEAWDGELRLDQQLAAFLAGLDQRVGADGWAMLVTSDHGAAHLPELSGGGRLRYAQIEAVANAAAERVLGPGHWIADPKFPTLYLSEAARDDARAPEAIAAIVAALRAQIGIGRVERTADLLGNCGPRPAEDRALCLGLDPERAGEVVYQPARNWLFEDDDEPLATSHGSFYDYDQEVPVIELAPGRARHAAATAPDAVRVPIEDVAGLLAGWLGVTAPRDLPRASAVSTRAVPR